MFSGGAALPLINYNILMSIFVQVHRSLLIEQTLLNTHSVTVNDLFLLSIGESCPKLINLYFFLLFYFSLKNNKEIMKNEHEASLYKTLPT